MQIDAMPNRTKQAEFSDCAQYVLQQTKHVIQTMGPRAPGSEGERVCQAYNQQELKKYCPDTALEPFRVRPGGFFLWLPIVGLLGMASLGVYFVLPWLALGLSVAGLVIMVAELVLYKQFIDPLFPAYDSANVYGVVPPKGEAKRRLIMAGHADATYEWRYAAVSPAFLKLMTISAIVGFLTVLVTDLISTALHLGTPPTWDSTWGMIGLIRLVFFPFFVGCLFFSNLKRVVPGANDNLSGAFAGLAVAKFFHDTNHQHENTELVYMVTGSEEAGLRGAKAYVKKHASDFEALPTIFLALETFRELEHMTIYHRDMNGIVKHDRRVCQLLKDAGHKVGYDLPYHSVYLGSSDATAFTQAGVPSVGIASMDPAPADYYHTRLDDWDNMSEEAVEAALRLLVQAVRDYDANGLPG